MDGATVNPATDRIDPNPGEQASALDLRRACPTRCARSRGNACSTIIGVGARRGRRPAGPHSARRVGRSRRRRPGQHRSATRRGCRCWRRRWSTARRATRSTMTTSTWRCRAIRRSRSCPACWRSPNSARVPAAKSSPPLSPATRPPAASAWRCGPAITVAAFTPPARSAASARRRPARGCSASMRRRPPRRSASPAPRRPGSSRNSARCASRSTPARRRRTACWRRVSRRAAFPAGPTSSNASRVSR